MDDIQLIGAHIVSSAVLFRARSAGGDVTFILARATLEDIHGDYFDNDLQTLAAFESAGARIRLAVRKVIARNRELPGGCPSILTTAEFAEFY